MKNERYYWLKMYDDFFTSTRIKKLRKIAGGDTYIVIYLKMQLIAMKQDGVLRWKGVEDKFADELALELDEDSANVEVTISYLVAQGMAEFVNDTTLFLPFAVKNVGSECSSAQRVRECRARAAGKKALPCEADNGEIALPCNAESLHCNTDIRDKRKDIENNIPPLPPKGGEDTKKRPSRAPEPETMFSGKLLAAVTEWLDYKWERNKAQYYKPIGYSRLMTQIQNSAKQYGEAALSEVIDGSIANNYQGICWENLKKGGTKPKTVYSEDSKALRAARYFADQKGRDNPGRAQPTEDDLQRWADEMERLHQENGVSWKVMAEVMDYSLDSEWWSRKVQSAFDFKRDFNKIFADMAKEQGAVKEE